MLVASLIFSVAAAGLSPISDPVPPNYILGTQEIYGTNKLYNFTQNTMLAEQRDAVTKLGANQMKIVLSGNSQKTCKSYELDCDKCVDLATLTAQPELAKMLADSRIHWYQFWLYSYANTAWAKKDWTSENLAAEYAETKAWAAYLLKTYSGTGKVFMAGNWEGDWILMGASGCTKPGGGFNLTCDPKPEVLQRMIQWGSTRQKAIDDARTEAVAAGVTNVTLLYYIEMNLGPQSLPPGSPGCSSKPSDKSICTSKPGVTNSVLKEVNPDLVSYSSYSATNNYAFVSDTKEVDALFKATLSHVQAQLSDKPTLGYHPLGFNKRVFVGEFGAKAGMVPNATFAVEYLARVYKAAIEWGSPMALYWELYSNNSTVPLIAPPPAVPGTSTQYTTLHGYFEEARAHAHLSSADFQTWAAAYWRARTSAPTPTAVAADDGC
jgi:hypothetical protein